MADAPLTHQNQLAPEANKFHLGNGDDGKHYWLTPPDLYRKLAAEFRFDFDPCPFPKPADFDGLTCEWGQSSYVNPPFGSIMHEGKKKGPTAWARKAIAEQQKGKRVVLVYPIDKWVLMLLAAGAEVRNLGDVKWLATEDGTTGKGTGRHIACFILEPSAPLAPPSPPVAASAEPDRQYICPVETVADLVNNLLLMDQSLPIYGAQGIEHQGRRRTITIPPTVSRERVKDSRWIGEGDELNAAIVWTRAPQPLRPGTAPLSDEQIEEIILSALEAPNLSWREFARAVERAHGIGHPTTPTPKDSA